MDKLILNWIDDETLDLSVELDVSPDRIDIATATHDEHGWSGTTLLEDVADRLSEALGLELIRV